MYTALLLAVSVLGQFDATPRLAMSTSGTLVQTWVHYDSPVGPVSMWATTPTASTLVSQPAGTNTPNSPDIDVDDAGNYVIVWTALDNNTGTTRGFLLYNSTAGASSAIELVSVAGCSALRVTMSRTGGKITIGWMAGGQYAVGRGVGGTPILGQMYQASGLTVTQTSNFFRVDNPPQYQGDYYFGNVSSGSNGDPVFVYVRAAGSGNTPAGVFVKGFTHSANASVKFQETAVVLLDSGHYTYADVDCSNDGGFYVGYNTNARVLNGVPSGVVSAQYDMNGSLLAPPTAVSNNHDTRFFIAVATRKITSGGTTAGCALAWSEGDSINWAWTSAMLPSIPPRILVGPDIGNVYSGASDGAGYFCFDYLNDVPSVSMFCSK